MLFELNHDKLHTYPFIRAQAFLCFPDGDALDFLLDALSCLGITLEESNVREVDEPCGFLFKQFFELGIAD